jgi:chromosome segregation ATPase
MRAARFGPPAEEGVGSRGHKPHLKAAFMTESIIYLASGFLAAALSALIAVPLIHRRARRLATRRLEDEVPSSVAKIMAETDGLRAEFAASSRSLEMTIEQLKTESASQLAELGRRDAAINLLGAELGTLHDQLRAAEEQAAAKAIALHEAERSLSEKESELAKLTGQLDDRLTVADVQKIEISALKIEIEALKEALEGSKNRLKTLEEHRDAARAEFAAQSQRLIEERKQAERALSEKESELSRLSTEFTKRLALADIEISAFKAEIEAMRQALD